MVIVRETEWVALWRGEDVSSRFGLRMAVFGRVRSFVHTLYVSCSCVECLIEALLIVNE